MCAERHFGEETGGVGVGCPSIGPAMSISSVMIPRTRCAFADDTHELSLL